MRYIIVAIAAILYSSTFEVAEAKSDKGLSAAFETYLKNRIQSETVIAKRELSHVELCGVLFRSVERFRKEVKRGSGRELEKHLTYESLVHLREIERACWRHKDVMPRKFKEGAEPAVINVDDMESGGVRNIEDPEDDSLEATARRDHMKWHPDEYEPSDAQEAGHLAELAWEVSERARELKSQLEEAIYEAFEARVKEEQAYNRGETEETIRGLIAERQEAEGKVIRLKSQIRGECMEARDAAIAAWVKKNAPVGAPEDMSPATSSGKTRQYADSEGNKVTEYDNGARSIEYKDGREVTVDPDGTKLTEYPDGHVVREYPDGRIECLKDHPDGVLRIVSFPDGSTDYYLNGEILAHYWPDWFPDKLVRHIDYIDPQSGLLPIERYPPMRRFWHWVDARDEDEGSAPKGNAAIAQHIKNRLEQFKKEHPGVFEDETFDEFVNRRFLELRIAHSLRTGDDKYTIDDKRDWYRKILTEWEAMCPDITLSLTDLVNKRKLEEKIRSGVSTSHDIPLGLDVENLRNQIQAYNDWLEDHPDRSQDEERERRQHAARLRNALKFQRSLYEKLVNKYGEEILRKILGNGRFAALKAVYDSLPKNIADDKVGGSVDPLDPDWPGRKPQLAQAAFSSLNGFTLVNGMLTGPDVTLTVIGIDGRERTPMPEEVRYESSYGDIILFVAPVLDIAGIVVSGNIGSVILSKFPPNQLAEDVSLFPLDGDIEIRNGQFSETLVVPSSMTDFKAPASAHKVRIGQGLTSSAKPHAGTIAVRKGEIAVMGQDADLPTLGNTECSIESPASEILSESAPSWGYEVQPQPVTAVNAWAPIFFQVAGLHPDEKLRITFSPPETVDVEPKRRKVKAVEFLMMSQIAQYRTSVIGPQPIGARIERLD